MGKLSDQKSVAPAKLSDEQLRKYGELNRLLREWMKDDSGEQERSWEILRRSLEENRSGYRKPSRD